MPIGDSGLCRVECEAGHKTAVVLVEHRFEWLFETGLSAIADCYYREAVSSFSASLERFYEYALVVLCEANSVAPETFIESWKTIASQSERQLGAFVAAYLLMERTPPRLLDPKKVQLRNDIVHKGKMPTEEEAEEFGDAVLAVIAPALGVLRTKYASAKATVDDRIERQRYAGVPASAARVTRFSFPMALRDINIDRIPPKPTRFYVERLAGYLGRE